MNLMEERNLEMENMQYGIDNCDVCPYWQMQNFYNMNRMAQMVNPMMMVPMSYINDDIEEDRSEGKIDEVVEDGRPMPNQPGYGRPRPRPRRRPGWYYCYWDGYKWNCPRENNNYNPYGPYYNKKKKKREEE